MAFVSTTSVNATQTILVNIVKYHNVNIVVTPTKITLTIALRTFL